MKKTNIIICLLLLCTLIFSSCIARISENTVTGEQREDLGEKPLDEGTVTDSNPENGDFGNTPENKDEVQKDEVPKSTVDALMEKYSAVKNPEQGIDTVALGFIESLKNADKEAVSTYVGGKSEYYTFLDSANITDAELIPIDIIQQQDSPYYGYFSHYNKYLCIINSDGSSEYFPSAESYYFLATENDSATGNTVTFFSPFERVATLYHGIDVPWKISYLADSFTDHYVSTLSLGKNNADSFDFHNVSGYHFIPHTMIRFDNSADMPHPYSMTEINAFIASAFDGNRGVELKTWQDFDLWVSIHDTSGYDVYKPEDEIYGCFYGHGAYSVWNEISAYSRTDEGIDLTVDTYADLAYFAKAKTLIFHFAPYDGQGTPCLLGIDVVNDTGLAEAGVGF